MRKDSSPSRLNESARETAKGSVGMMLGFVGGTLGVFFLILGAVGLLLFSFFMYELFFYYNR